MTCTLSFFLCRLSHVFPRTLCHLTERVIPHKLFTPLLIGMVATGAILSLFLAVLLYKYMQVRLQTSAIKQPDGL